MKQRKRQYWAFRANPQIYKIEDVLKDGVEIERWNNPHNSDIRAGDRALIWQKSSKGQPGGIVALGDILEDSQPGDDINGEYWSDQQDAHKNVARVTFRYIRHEDLPLWEERADFPMLKTLKPATAQMGGVFHVSSDEWDALMQFLGGWPASAPEIAPVASIIAESAGKISSRQGYAINAKQRRAIEQYAMQRAKAFYEEQGYHVDDVSETHSYDLLCQSANRRELHVEVKGTTSDGTQILLTPNEVKHAQVYPNVALFILSHIQVDPTNPEKLHGGEYRCLDPWNIQEGTLSSLAYSYNLKKR